MTIVVGYSSNTGGRSALELGATLARSAGQELLVVAVTPAAWPTPVAGGVDREFKEWARRSGEQTLEEARAVIAEHCSDLAATAITISGRSVGSALVARAVEIDASMIVVGSGTDGSWGTVVISSTSDWLLHSSPVPVAVATRGFRAGPAETIARATCAFRGDEASRDMLGRAAEVCADVGASLRVATFGVLGRTMYPPEVKGEQQVLDAYVEHTSAEQDRAVAALAEAPPELRPSSVETAVATGRSWAEALSSLPWERGDVLVVGSSSASLMKRLFLGSHASKIVRHSPVPVICIP